MLGKIRLIKSVFTHIWEDLIYTLSFLRNYEDEEVIFAQLRKNAHILDKGLHIVPFEKGHGTKIYEQCKDLRNKITDERIKSDPAFLWIGSVVDKYEQAQLIGVGIEDSIEQFVYSDKDKADFYRMIKSRISCRSFTDEVISDGIWDEIIDISADAPSGCCRQTERYYIENNCERIKQLVPNIAGATGFSGSIPYLICVTVDTRSYYIKDRLLPYIDTSLSIQNFLLACSINNIYGTPLNFQHAKKREIENVKKILNIPEYERVILFIAAGKAEKLPLKPKRIDIKWIRKR